MTAPGQYLYNPAFQTKMMLMAIAGVNMAVFYATTASAVNRDRRGRSAADAGAGDRVRVAGMLAGRDHLRAAGDLLPAAGSLVFVVRGVGGCV